MFVVFVDSILFLFLSMVLIATSLYLPEHVSTIAKRAFYYYAGDAETGVLSSVSQGAVAAVKGTGGLGEEVTAWAAKAVETAAEGREAAAGVAAGEL